MNDWLVIIIIIAVFGLIIGNFSIVQKSAKTPLRKKGLNDLQETLPRSKKSPHTMPIIVSKDSVKLTAKSALETEIDKIEEQVKNKI
jgi:hypothetical protein